MEDKGLVSQGMQGGFASIASAFVVESLEHMIPWLMVMFAVIMTDLAFGLRKSKLMKIKIRWSRAIRITMGKMVTYFAFVCMVCMINTAMGNNYSIDKWACAAVCAVEGISIIGNYLRPKGIELSSVGALRLLFHKVAHVDNEDLKEILEKVEQIDGYDKVRGNAHEGKMLLSLHDYLVGEKVWDEGSMGRRKKYSFLFDVWKIVGGMRHEYYVSGFLFKGEEGRLKYEYVKNRIEAYNKNKLLN